MGLFKVIRPEAGTNIIINPVAGTNTTGWSTSGGAITRDREHARFGPWSFKIVTGAGVSGSGATYTLATDTVTGTHRISFYYWSGDGATINVKVTDNVTTRIDTNIAMTANRWVRYDLGTVTVTDNVNLYIDFLSTSTASVAFWIDGLDAKAQSYLTDHVNGDLPGHTWADVKHGSQSSRPAYYRPAGRVLDLTDDLSFIVTGVSGMGHLPVTLHAEDYAVLPGSYPLGEHLDARVWELRGVIVGTTEASLAAKRDALERLLSPSYPGGQPVAFEYTGGARTVRWYARLAGGLQLQRQGGGGFIEHVELRFWSDDPMVYEDNQEVCLLDPMDSLTANYVARRLNGQWGVVDSGVTGGAAPAVHAVAAAEDGTVYVGGDFTSAGGTVVNYITKLVAGQWTALNAIGTTGVNGVVRAIAPRPDGKVVIAGEFTTAGGVAHNRIVLYDPVADTFSAMGAGGADGTVYGLAIDPTNMNTVAVGSYANIGGVAASKVAYWNGSAWSSLSSSTDDIVYAVAVDQYGVVWVGGSFTTLNGLTFTRIAYYSGGVWNAPGAGGGANGNVLALSYDRARARVYAGGAFTTLDGNAANRVGYATGDGAALYALGSGVAGGNVNAVVVMPDGTLYAGGAITSADSLAVGGLALWTGARWVYPDWAATNPAITSLATDDYGNLWVGFGITTCRAGGVATATNNGSAPAEAALYLESNDTVQWLENTSLVNVPTPGIPGPRQYLNMLALSGERLKLDIARGVVRSSWQRRGLQSMVLDATQTDRWRLATGANSIACFIDGAGTEVVGLYWQVRHLGIDTQ